MYFGKESALKQHLKHNVPETLWYYTHNNGVTRVAPARAVELQINPIRKELKPGCRMAHYKIFTDGFSPTLNFSDRTDLMFHVSGRPMRVKNGIFASLQEFQMFRDVFPVIPGTAFWVPEDSVIKNAVGRDDGEIDQTASFPRMIEHARKLIAWSNDQLK